MYATLLRDEQFPVSLATSLPSISPASLVDLTHAFGVIARVRIETPEPEYPYRSNGHVTFPIGTFTTVLCGPEIARVAIAGRIKSVGEYYVYNLARPFTESVSKLLAARADAKRRADNGAEVFAKLVANSLAGRLAQRAGKWARDARRDEAGRWGEYDIESDDVTKTQRLRYLAGQCWRWCADDDGAGPHTAAFSYLCAYGRQVMRAIRAICPARSVVCQDTDGLYLLPSGVAALEAAGKLGDGAPGQLRIKDSADSARFWGPRHFRMNDRWTLSGLHYSMIDRDAHRAYVTSRTPLFDMTPHAAPTETVKRSQWVQIPRDLAEGVVGEDGWVTPRRISVPWFERDS